MADATSPALSTELGFFWPLWALKSKIRALGAWGGGAREDAGNAPLGSCRATTSVGLAWLRATWFSTPGAPRPRKNPSHRPGSFHAFTRCVSEADPEDGREEAIVASEAATDLHTNPEDLDAVAGPIASTAVMTAKLDSKPLEEAEHLSDNA